ncbi:MAG TPA: glucoamylase family protein [Candidatus Eisenbacteria bacterium]|nr:glucoamylase family protein [Candidatus Eisenbacteria bacterium]
MSFRRAGFAVTFLALLAISAGPKVAAPPERGGETLSPAAHAFLDTLAERTFRYFWDLSDSLTGLTPDRWPTQSFISVGAVGFALTAYPIGAEHGWVTRAAAAERTRRTLRFFHEAKQDTAAAGSTGYRGFFYHFLDPRTGHRFEKVELSTMDTALLLAGALFCQSYFDRDDPVEKSIRDLAEAIYRRVDWRWAQPRPPLVALGWNPESGHLPYDWRGLNETMILHVLALGSPTHAIDPAVWPAWAKGYRWGTFHGQPHLGFAPLFGHQYSHVWIDFRGIRDPYMRGKGIDYFENSRRATLAQRAYAIANPAGFKGYGPELWGLTACDGPVDATLEMQGRSRTFRTYAARGASFTEIVDDGTVSPTALGGSIPFAPKPTVDALMAIRRRYGPDVFSTYGFVDALNPTFDRVVKVQHGRVVAGVGWFDTDYLGIDQGPILAMIENHRTGLVWKVLRTNPHIVRGLKRAGFTGGWIDRAQTAEAAGVPAKAGP